MFSRTSILEMKLLLHAVEAKAVLASRGQYTDAATCTARRSYNQVCCDEPGHAECKLKACINVLPFYFHNTYPKFSDFSKQYWNLM